MTLAKNLSLTDAQRAACDKFARAVALELSGDPADAKYYEVEIVPSLAAAEAPLDFSRRLMTTLDCDEDGVESVDVVELRDAQATPGARRTTVYLCEIDGLAMEIVS